MAAPISPAPRSEGSADFPSSQVRGKRRLKGNEGSEGVGSGEGFADLGPPWLDLKEISYGLEGEKGNKGNGGL